MWLEAAKPTEGFHSNRGGERSKELKAQLHWCVMTIIILYSGLDFNSLFRFYVLKLSYYTVNSLFKKLVFWLVLTNKDILNK